MEVFATEVVVAVVEVEVQRTEKSFPDFENTTMDIEDTLEIAKEAYSHGYNLSILVAKVELGYFLSAMVAKAFASSTMEGKYCKVCTVVM